MDLFKAKSKVLAGFLNLAQKTQVPFVLANCQDMGALAADAAVWHVFVLAKDISILKETWVADVNMQQNLFWQDAETEGQNYFFPIHTPHICLNGSTWSLPGWDDLPVHQGLFLAIHPLSRGKDASWTGFWQKKQYRKLQKQIWKLAWEDEKEKLAAVLPEDFYQKVQNLPGSGKQSLEELLTAKRAYINSKVGESLLYYDLWGGVQIAENLTSNSFSELGRKFAEILTVEETEGADNVAALKERLAICAEILQESGKAIILPQVEKDVAPFEIDC